MNKSLLKIKMVNLKYLKINNYKNSYVTKKIVMFVL